MQRVVLDLELLGGRNLLEPRDDRVRSDTAEIEALQPRENRRGGIRDFLRLGRREYEHDPGWRLLENLQECVPCLAREHVRFIDDVDLGARLRTRGIHRALAQIAGIVHAAVRRGVELDDIQTGCTGPDPPAGIALPARLARPSRGAPLAIQRHRENPGRGRLADSSRPGEEVAVRDPALGHRPAQRRGDMTLDDEVGELLGAVLAR